MCERPLITGLPVLSGKGQVARGPWTRGFPVTRRRENFSRFRTLSSHSPGGSNLKDNSSCSSQNKSLLQAQADVSILRFATWPDSDFLQSSSDNPTCVPSHRPPGELCREERPPFLCEVHWFLPLVLCRAFFPMAFDTECNFNPSWRELWVGLGSPVVPWMSWAGS